jgi:hypothetical protein
MGKFSEVCFEFTKAEIEFSDALLDAGLSDFMRLGWDHYDNSIEIYGVPNDELLPDEAQKLIYDAGFSIAYVNYRDGFERHYRFDVQKPFQKTNGSRTREKRHRGTDSERAP